MRWGSPRWAPSHLDTGAPDSATDVAHNSDATQATPVVSAGPQDPPVREVPADRVAATTAAGVVGYQGRPLRTFFVGAVAPAEQQDPRARRGPPLRRAGGRGAAGGPWAWRCTNDPICGAAPTGGLRCSGDRWGGAVMEPGSTLLSLSQAAAGIRAKPGRNTPLQHAPGSRGQGQRRCQSSRPACPETEGPSTTLSAALKGHRRGRWSTTHHFGYKRMEAVPGARAVHQCPVQIALNKTDRIEGEADLRALGADSNCRGRTAITDLGAAQGPTGRAGELERQASAGKKAGTSPRSSPKPQQLASWPAGSWSAREDHAPARHLPKILRGDGDKQEDSRLHIMLPLI